MVLPCALRGQYDVFVQARLRGSIKIEAHAAHPQSSWSLLNRTHHIRIRTQNLVRNRQMIVKWDKRWVHHYLFTYSHTFITQRFKSKIFIDHWLTFFVLCTLSLRCSKFDFHAVHYCLVVNTQQRQLNFCNAVNDYFTSATGHENVGAPANCYPSSLVDFIWLRPPERAKKIGESPRNCRCL